MFIYFLFFIYLFIYFLFFILLFLSSYHLVHSIPCSYWFFIFVRHFSGGMVIVLMVFINTLRECRSAHQAAHGHALPLGSSKPHGSSEDQSNGVTRNSQVFNSSSTILSQYFSFLLRYQTCVQLSQLCVSLAVLVNVINQLVSLQTFWLLRLFLFP